MGDGKSKLISLPRDVLVAQIDPATFGANAFWTMVVHAEAQGPRLGLLHGHGQHRLARAPSGPQGRIQPGDLLVLLRPQKRFLERFKTQRTGESTR
jgi:hypothetical protein